MLPLEYARSFYKKVVFGFSIFFKDKHERKTTIKDLEVRLLQSKEYHIEKYFS